MKLYRQPAFYGARNKVKFLLLFIFFLPVFITCSVSPAYAQKTSPVVEFNDLSARVIYNDRVNFNCTGHTRDATFEGLELRVKYGRNGQEKAFKLGIKPGQDISITYTIFRDNGELVAGMPLLYTWKATLNGGVQVSSPQKVVYYEDTRFQWRQIEGNKVVVRWYSGDQDYGNTMYNLAVDSLNTYRQRFSMVTSSEIYISIYNSEKDFFSATDQEVPEWAGGVAYPEHNEILLVAPQSDYTGQYIGYGIPHELAHIALYQFSGHTVTHWIDEGFAVYNQNRTNPEYDGLVKNAAANNSLLPFDSISATFPSDSTQAKLAYAQSRNMVDFLISKYGDQVFVNLLDQLRKHSVNDSFLATYGVNLDTMTGYWRNNILGKPVTLPKALLNGPVSPYPPVPAEQGFLSSNLVLPIVLIGLAVLVAGGVLLLIFGGWRKDRHHTGQVALAGSTPGIDEDSSLPNGGNGTRVITNNGPLITPPPEKPGLAAPEPDPLDIIQARYLNNWGEG